MDELDNGILYDKWIPKRLKGIIRQKWNQQYSMDRSVGQWTKNVTENTKINVWSDYKG